jgi:hypothetical protein
MSPTEARRRNSAIETMRREAAERGFVLAEVRQIDRGGTVKLISTMPNGREITATYEKADEPTA